MILGVLIAVILFGGAFGFVGYHFGYKDGIAEERENWRSGESDWKKKEGVKFE